MIEIVLVEIAAGKLRINVPSSQSQPDPMWILST